jgi:hypothetical protein
MVSAGGLLQGKSEQRHEAYHVRDLRSTLGTIVNGQPIGDHFCSDDVLLRAGENEVIAGGSGSPFVFSVSQRTADRRARADCATGVANIEHEIWLPGRQHCRKLLGQTKPAELLAET